MGVAVEMTADDAKLMRRLARQEQQLEKLQEKYKQLAREGQRAGTKTARSMKQVNDDAFGDKAIGKVTRYVAGIASIAAVANLGRQALGDLSRQADELSAKQRQSEM